VKINHSTKVFFAMTLTATNWFISLCSSVQAPFLLVTSALFTSHLSLSLFLSQFYPKWIKWPAKFCAILFLQQGYGYGYGYGAMAIVWAKSYLYMTNQNIPMP
jgi:hypothetical protein